MEDSLRMVYLCDINDEYQMYESISFDKDGFMNIVTLEGEHVKQRAPSTVHAIYRKTYADAVQTKEHVEEMLEELAKQNKNYK